MTSDEGNGTIGVANTHITRRRALAGMAAGVTSVGAVAVGTREATAQADVTGEFTATGDEATLSNAPAAIHVDATGEYDVETTGALDQIRITLQATVDGNTDDLVSDTIFEGTSGSYALSADVIADHRDVEAADFMPAEGESKATDVRVRVVCSAVQDGTLVAEGAAEDTVTVVVDHEGVAVAIGGTASVSIETA